MKFITVRDFRNSSAKIWKNLEKEQEMVITNNGKPIALLTPLDDKNLENTLKAVRKAKAVNAVKQMQEISLNNGNHTMTDEEILSEIKQARTSNESSY